MLLPPFPSQDLAKLVLGYLAEEQLMTAYDEFLQASPYLDALSNEYDRIFMTSLKSILAEYRAVKIYLETCTPHLLRKKLLQCVNLLETVKCLLQMIDLNKLDTQEQNVDQIRKMISSFGTLKTTSKVDSLFLPKSTHIVTSSNVISESPLSGKEIEVTLVGNSVETSSLEDLPGTSFKNESSKVHDHESRKAETSSPLQTLNSEAGQTSSASSQTNTTILSTVDKSTAVNQSVNSHYTDELINKPEPIRKIDEFKNILDFVCENGSTIQNKTSSVVNNAANQYQRLTSAGTFQDFATGIQGNKKTTLNYCLKAETNTVQAHLRKNNCNVYVNNGTNNATDSKTHSTREQLPGSNVTSSSNTNILHPLIDDHKHEKNKIKILSDIKLTPSYEHLHEKSKMPPVLCNATSTPMQMQTIIINGTAAYKNNVPCEPTYNFTKDEIMAMPTIILVSETEATLKNHCSETLNSSPKKKNAEIVTMSTTENLLKPLTIDVSSNISDQNLDKNPPTIQNDKEKELSEQKYVKTIETTGHMSMPKDNTLPSLDAMSTPHGLLPQRKSSSTPRKTSHIRVLDFATPRILYKSIKEENNDESVENTEDLEVVQTMPKVTDTKVNTPIAAEKLSCSVNIDRINLNSLSAKENKTVLPKKTSWDADLRALTINIDDTDNSHKPKQQSRNKARTIKKKDVDDTKLNKREKEKNKKKSKKVLVKESSNKNKSKSKGDDEEVEDIYKNDQKVPVVVKPNINIIPNNRGIGPENDKNQSKSNTSNVCIETPESERIALQNVIGANLNLSDILQTPYKQALYDIQMETPKFLGPDLPNDPISDIKILNIPTPRFLCSPKGPSATPSTYSSRPTDYSSGGSYYKPDDQDYIISPEFLKSPITTEEEGQNILNDDKSHKDNVNKSKSHRPVRQCRKNISYFKNISTCIKVKESVRHYEQNDTVASSSDKNQENQDNCKTFKETAKKPKKKSDNNRKNSSLQNPKPPFKRETPKTFMKIKPRKLTPIKESKSRKSRNLSESSQNKPQKRTSNKEKNVNFTPTAEAIPTKSRRKSSTPRKISCTKTFSSENSCRNVSDMSKLKEDAAPESQVTAHDSDQIRRERSDDGPYDGKHKNKVISEPLVNDSDDISKIKEYIETTIPGKSESTRNSQSCLHVDLIKRGFDVETAKIIERDLLDTPCSQLDRNVDVKSLKYSDYKGHDPGSNVITANTPNIEILEDKDDDSEEIELSVNECNEDTINYIYHKYDDRSYTLPVEPENLRDNFTMEICIDDDVTIRLRATRFTSLFEQNLQDVDLNYSYKETETAVTSILHIDRLYTPIKDTKTQIYEIFDSTLTSVDTPLKENSPKQEKCRSLVTEVAVEVEQVESKEKYEVKKRKRSQSGYSAEDATNGNKKTKTDTQYLLNTASIQNIDIESVLSKLHGP